MTGNVLFEGIPSALHILLWARDVIAFVAAVVGTTAVAANVATGDVTAGIVVASDCVGAGVGSTGGGIGAGHTLNLMHVACGAVAVVAADATSLVVSIVVIVADLAIVNGLGAIGVIVVAANDGECVSDDGIPITTTGSTAVLIARNGTDSLVSATTAIMTNMLDIGETIGKGGGDVAVVVSEAVIHGSGSGHDGCVTGYVLMSMAIIVSASVEGMC